MAAPRGKRRLSVVVSGVAITSALALLAGVGVASVFAGDGRDVGIAFMVATAVTGVVGGFAGAPFYLRAHDE